VTGREEWQADPRFESNPKRVENRETLLPMVADLMKEKSCDEWMEILVEASIPAGPVNNMENLFNDPQVKHRDMIAEVPHPTIGTLKLAGAPVKYSETPAQVKQAPPILGQHTEEILEKVLGYAPEKIDRLRRGEVV
jgi:formyl-CoA transferase